jgi:hypothetical protein
MTQTTTNPVGSWIDEAREVNSTWRCMIPSNILAASLELSSIFDEGEDWLDQWCERFNEDEGTDLTLEEFTELVHEYIKPEIEYWWHPENVMKLSPAAWEQLEWENGATWEEVVEALEPVIEAHEDMPQYISDMTAELRGSVLHTF